MLGKNLWKKRYAFVIGNSAYQHVGPLDNPKNDATAMVEALSALGFKVTPCIDCDRAGMMEALEDFQRKIDGADEVVFYYCGHGLQIDSENWLVPTDAKLVLRQDLPRLINFNDVVDRLEKAKAKVKLFFLDACRNDPFKRDAAQVAERARELNIAAPSGNEILTTQKGLAKVEAGSDTLIAFAAAPGKLAIDGHAGAKNSPYTEAMLKHIRTCGLELQHLMGRVGNTVQTQSRRHTGSEEQVPWISTNLHKHVYFNPPSWEPVYTLGLGALVAGLVTGPFVFEDGDFVGAPGIGLLFGLVVAYGVWRWGRGTWWAALIAATTTTLAWWGAGHIIRNQVLTTSDPVYIGFFGTLSALLALIGTLGGVAVTSKAFRNVTAWALTAMGSVLVTAIYFGATYLVDKAELLDDVIRYAAVGLWYGALGASLGSAFARHVPSGPDPE